MNEKYSKTCLITFNVIVMMAGMLMFVGGLLLEYTPITSSILGTLHTNVTSSQVGAIGVAMIAIGAFIILVSFVGCCGAVYESRGLLFIYFVIVFLLFLGQIAIAVVAFVYGSETFYDTIEDQLQRYVNGYGRNQEYEDALVDTVQQFFGCCGYNGTEDYSNYNPTPSTTTSLITTVSSTALNQTSPAATNMSSTMVTATAVFDLDTTPELATTTPELATTAQIMTTEAQTNSSEEFFTGLFWPESCCKNGADVTNCMNNSLPVSALQEYLNTEGCTMSIEQWVKDNLYVIGGVCIGIALIELISMIMACSLRRALD